MSERVWRTCVEDGCTLPVYSARAHRCEGHRAAREKARNRADYLRDRDRPCELCRRPVGGRRRIYCEGCRPLVRAVQDKVRVTEEVAHRRELVRRVVLHVARELQALVAADDLGVAGMARVRALGNALSRLHVSPERMIAAHRRRRAREAA